MKDRPMLVRADTNISSELSGNECVTKIILLISEPKHMLWVLKRMVSMRLFFSAPKTYVNING